jgi:hypothetical protein
VCGRIAGSLGSPLPPRPRIFTRAHAVSLRPPSAPSFDEVSSSSGLSASLSAAACALPFVPGWTSRPSRSAEERLPWGPRPSSRHQLAASTTPRGIPTPRSSSVLDVSHVLDGLLRHQPSRVCFTPQPRPGFALQGIVPLHGAVRGFPRRFMPSGWLNASACGCPRQPLRPQLQGFAPRGECGVVRGGLDPDRSAPLLGFSSSGFSLRATCRRLHTRSALDVRRDEPTAARLRRFAVARIGLPGIRLPTRSSFPA